MCVCVCVCVCVPFATLPLPVHALLLTTWWCLFAMQAGVPTLDCPFREAKKVGQVYYHTRVHPTPLYLCHA